MCVVVLGFNTIIDSAGYISCTHRQSWRREFGLETRPDLLTLSTIRFFEVHITGVRGGFVGFLCGMAALVAAALSAFAASSCAFLALFASVAASFSALFASAAASFSALFASVAASFSALLDLASASFSAFLASAATFLALAVASFSAFLASLAASFSTLPDSWREAPLFHELLEDLRPICVDLGQSLGCRAVRGCSCRGGRGGRGGRGSFQPTTHDPRLTHGGGLCNIRECDSLSRAAHQDAEDSDHLACACSRARLALSAGWCVTANS